MQIKIDEIRTLTENRLKEMFKEPSSNAKLVKVVIEPGEDWDGDKILDIVFVFDGVRKLDIEKVLDLGRLVQIKAAEIVDDEDRYPMIDFINKKDAEAMGIGTAA